MNINQIIEQEGNHKDFEYKGYKCHIHRNPSMLFLCGYVEVPQENKFHENDGEDLDVHGGITWSDTFCLIRRRKLATGY